MNTSHRLRRFRIEVLHDGQEFAPGESISGALLIEPYPTHIVAKVRVGIHGTAKVFWTKGISTRSSSQYQHMKSITNSHDYFHVERSVFENRRASAPGGPLEHRPRILGLTGAEEFPFVFKLPEKGFPASWKGPHGTIQYWIDAVAEVGGKDCFKETVAYPFRVVSHLDSAKLPNPKLQTEKFPVSGFACVPASIHVTFGSLCSVYFPGEGVQLRIHLRNTSPWQILAKICLIQNQTYISQASSNKRVRDNLAQMDCPLIPAHTDIDWQKCSLVIPRSCMPSVSGCAIIRVDYQAVLHLKVRRHFSQHFVISTPIVVVEPRRRSITATSPLDVTADNTTRTAGAEDDQAYAERSTKRDTLSQISEDSGTEKDDEAPLEQKSPGTEKSATLMTASSPVLAVPVHPWQESRKSV